MTDRVHALVDRGASLPSIPALGLELLSIIRKPIDSIDMRELVSLVEKDPTLVARILRVSNSVYYGVRREVTSVRHAITLVGLDETINYLNFYLIKAVMPECPTLNHFSADDFWSHSWSTAVAARMLGRPQLLVTALPGELYLAGLLHDIGKVVLAVHMTEDFEKALEMAHVTQIPLHEAEKHIFGVDHALLGAHLLDNWNLPGWILDAVAFHHDPGESPAEHQEMAMLIQFANSVTNHFERTAGDAHTVPVLETAIVAREESAFSSPVTLNGIIEEIGDTLDARDDILNPSEETEEPDTEVEAEGGEASQAEPQSAAPETAPSSSAKRAAKKSIFRSLLDSLSSLLD